MSVYDDFMGIFAEALCEGSEGNEALVSLRQGDGVSGRRERTTVWEHTAWCDTDGHLIVSRSDRRRWPAGVVVWNEGAGRFDQVFKNSMAEAEARGEVLGKETPFPVAWAVRFG